MLLTLNMALVSFWMLSNVYLSDLRCLILKVVTLGLTRETVPPAWCPLEWEFLSQVHSKTCIKSQNVLLLQNNSTEPFKNIWLNSEYIKVIMKWTFRWFIWSIFECTHVCIVYGVYCICHMYVCRSHLFKQHIMKKKPENTKGYLCGYLCWIHILWRSHEKIIQPY